MIISFSNNKLRKVFNSEKELVKRFGKENARYIMRRMTVLYAAPSLEDVPFRPPDRRHELAGDRKGTFAVDIKHPFRLIFKPDHNPVPLKEDGGVDLKKVTSIIIPGVEDYH